MILFLGGGFIANALSPLLTRAGLQHRTVSRDADDNPPDSLRADLAALTHQSPVFDGVSTAVYFAHGSVPYSSMQDIRLDAENILNAISLFEILAGRGVRVIYVSSGGSVYGEHEGKISEDVLPSPISAYGVSKYTIENYLRMFHHNYSLPYDILRFSNVYGVGQPGNRPQGIVYALARAFVRREKFEIWGDGSAVKDYLYIDDAAKALMRVLESSTSNDTFNVSYGSSVSIREIISLFEKQFGYAIEIGGQPAFDFDVQNVALNNRKFAEAYDWEPAVDLEAGIRETIDWITKSVQDSQA